ncbi:hypothetical protein OROMI_021545 [Orobanche minor]
MWMMTPTLLDVAAITSLLPTGDTYNPSDASDNVFFNFKELAFSNFIPENRGEDDTEVSPEEHVAFLTLWLSHYVFCSKSLQVAKCFIPMAIQIHEGKQFGLGKLILAALYEGMRLACDNLRNPLKQKGFQIVGPFWLLQLWLNATFTDELNLGIGTDYLEKVNKRDFEGFRLVHLLPRHIGVTSKIIFMRYMRIFMNIKKFKPQYAPWMERKTGPYWYGEDFPVFDPANAEEVNEIWKIYLTPTVLSCRIENKKSGFGLVGYQPNLVSRQFGLSQPRPKSLFSSKQKIVLGGSISKEIFEQYLRAAAKENYQIDDFEFMSSYFCTVAFDSWWEEYYNGKYLGDDILIANLKSGFSRAKLEDMKKQAKPKVKKTISKQQLEDAMGNTSEPSRVRLQVKKEKDVEGSKKSIAEGKKVQKDDVASKETQNPKKRKRPIVLLTDEERKKKNL